MEHAQSAWGWRHRRFKDPPATYAALSQPDVWSLGSLTRDASYSSPMARLSTLSVSAGATTILSRNYGCDNAGNLTSLTDTTFSTPLGSQTFAYDDRDRVTSWTSSLGSETYTYDPIGNLQSKTGVGAYRYSAAHPHAVTTAGAFGFGYDANGNMTSTGGMTTTWDAENRPTSIARVSGSETYAYDADGERIGRTAGYTTTVFLGGLWQEDVASGVVGITRVLYGFNGATVAQRTHVTTPSSDSVIYLHGDHLGSVSVVSGWNGTQTTFVSSQRFDPWGKVLAGGTVTQTRTNYTGQELDTTGLLYYHARYYDPNLARFVSADSIIPGQSDGAGAANPQNLNRYAYVGNNPLTRTDPTGHDWEHLAQFALGVAEGAVTTITSAVETSTPYGAASAGVNIGIAIGSDPAGFVQGVKDWGANIARGADFAWNDTAGAVAALYEDSRGLGRVMGTAAATAAMAAVGPKCSFSADTLVTTASGDQPIGTLHVGDHVLAYNQAIDSTGSYTVTAVLVHSDPVIEYLTIDGERLETTPEHPFFTREQGWIAAGALWPGAHIRRADNSTGVVQAAVIVPRIQVMYNLTVAVAHTFFVGEGQWLVHNTCGGLDDLAQRRQDLGLPAVGSPGADETVLARLDVGGESFYGINSPGVDHPGLPMANPNSLKHAEWDAFGQASEAFPSGVGGGKATLYVDRRPCGYCRSNFGKWANHLGLDELEVKSNNGYRGTWDSGSNRYRTVR